jgi:hypothetical protein
MDITISCDSKTMAITTSNLLDLKALDSHYGMWNKQIA